MFDAAHVLENFDAEVYVRALVAVAQTDGVRDEERAFITDHAGALGVPVPDFETRIDVGTVGAGTSDVTRRMIVRDCIVLAALDGDFSSAERERIKDIAGHLGVSPAMAQKLEAWVTKYAEVVEEGQQLLASE